MKNITIIVKRFLFSLLLGLMTTGIVFAAHKRKDIELPEDAQQAPQKKAKATVRKEKRRAGDLPEDSEQPNSKKLKPADLDEKINEDEQELADYEEEAKDDEITNQIGYCKPCTYQNSPTDTECGICGRNLACNNAEQETEEEQSGFSPSNTSSNSSLKNYALKAYHALFRTKNNQNQNYPAQEVEIVMCDKCEEPLINGQDSVCTYNVHHKCILDALKFKNGTCGLCNKRVKEALLSVTITENKDLMQNFVFLFLTPQELFVLAPTSRSINNALKKFMENPPTRWFAPTVHNNVLQLHPKYKDQGIVKLIQDATFFDGIDADRKLQLFKSASSEGLIALVEALLSNEITEVLLMRYKCVDDALSNAIEMKNLKMIEALISKRPYDFEYTEALPLMLKNGNFKITKLLCKKIAYKHAIIDLCAKGLLVGGCIIAVGGSIYIVGKGTIYVATSWPVRLLLRAGLAFAVVRIPLGATSIKKIAALGVLNYFV